MSEAIQPSEISKMLRHEGGILYWTEGALHKGLIGKKAGNFTGSSYVRVKISGKEYPAHRVVWCIEFGVWPTGPIDHKDRNPKNNHPANLRECKPAQNSMNRGFLKEYKGTTKHRCGKYQSQIKVNGKSIYLGLFESEVEAAKAYDAVASLHFGEFAVPNFGGAA